ncbi:MULTISPECIES: hypothetical protein [unclassified Pseudomonas]|uniref:hypothetical protein n=1 Tax=unclassified Pseudomonas TaxID=196821 RepID=UPI000FDF5198|nr:MULTISPECIES: hypothetical protein [unclassified Pseudomonas]AZZ74527.1 hypothetical protein CCX46_05050 [Pseudomonas sp. RU47]QHF49075.1 hypothetical protein PspS49_05400 [Pseudomonas sp. S49]WNZ85365.1 hypothetical protein QOM10_05310 [Pseudomonas sp. P108]
MTGAITFPDADLDVDPNQPYLNCNSNPMQGLKVAIGPLRDVQVGAVLNISWEGFEDKESTKPVKGTLNSVTHFVTEDDREKGFVVKIGDYFQHLKPIRSGWGKASYTINGAGIIDASLRVYLIYPSGDFCDEVTD